MTVNKNSYEQEKETIKEAKKRQRPNFGHYKSRSTTASATKELRIGIIILLAACYLLNSPILQMVYPKVSEDYYQYVEFVATRAKVYECMFFLFFWLVFLSTERMVKSLAAGMMVLTAGSVVDKLIFGFTSYLYTDYLLIAVAIIISIRVYVREIR